MTAAGQKRQHCGCVETQILCSLASVQRVWLQVVCNLGQKKIWWLVKQSLCSSLAQIKEGIFTVLGTFTGSLP